ncbi:MAG: hypothetical protein QNL04_12555 [SAR324 cluster bacterium]|nr:hypothetical protein [SAR324 cluster bacterium]
MPEPERGRREGIAKQQIAARGVTDARVIAAMNKIERHLFVGPEDRESAYEDFPLPIGFGQTISQPYMVANMSEQLRLNAGSQVLEVGTGCGY